jgi:hypothetical protein
MHKSAYFCLTVIKWQLIEIEEKSGENRENKGGSATGIRTPV